ncbi:M15 family metallopeptidase [Patescibacteria group bacterium]|nr:M15 family metallopeptidase [Patescibacteria group bacterium]
MEEPQIPPHSHLKIRIISISLLIIVLGLIGYGVFIFSNERVKNITLETKVKELEEALRNSNDSLTREQEDKKALSDALAQAGQENESFADELEKVEDEFKLLNKLTKTDPQLLQKYSKVYFLNENYAPSELTVIDTEYNYNKQKPLEIHDRVWPFLEDLFDAAKDDGINLQVISAFRSFGTQAVLKSGYRTTYGAGANTFSADQGYSEHQLGTTLDFTSQKVGASFVGFEKTPEYTWLLENAHNYGFILSYPANNKYYVFEPWHWRFVGLDLAKKIHDENKNFYDLDQREISSYLVKIFNRRLSDND